MPPEWHSPVASSATLAQAFGIPRQPKQMHQPNALKLESLVPVVYYYGSMV
jgi:hypothetical protein